MISNEPEQLFIEYNAMARRYGHIRAVFGSIASLCLVFDGLLFMLAIGAYQASAIDDLIIAVTIFIIVVAFHLSCLRGYTSAVTYHEHYKWMARKAKESI